MTTAPFNIDTIVETTFVRSVRFLETTSSTNEVAKDMARGGSPEWPLLIITNRQTAGRGRHGNRWWSASGSLTFSVVIGGVFESEGLIAFAAALAISKAIEKTCPSAGPKLKWPNDVFLANKKVAGVLIESVITPDQRLFVVGIGVNSNCDISIAPKAVRDLATSLSSEFDIKLDQESFLIEVLTRLDQYLDSAIHTPVEIVDSFQHASQLEVSARLTVRSANGLQRSGEFAGFGTHGQLLMKIGSEIEELATGTIVEYT